MLTYVYINCEYTSCFCLIIIVDISYDWRQSRIIPIKIRKLWRTTLWKNSRSNILITEIFIYSFAKE